MHKKDVKVSAKWNFLATSHGKQPCDGIGGTVKRLVAKASLQRNISNQILNAHSMFEFCWGNIQHLFFFVAKDEVLEARQRLEKRLVGTKAVPGTRSFHQFEPVSEIKIAARRCSKDIQYDFVHDLYASGNKEPISICIFDYVACIYDGTWWIFVVLEKNEEELDVLIKSMHPSGPTRSIHWSEKEDLCWIPETKIICTTAAPCTVSGTQYTITRREIDKIEMKILGAH